MATLELGGGCEANRLACTGVRQIPPCSYSLDDALTLQTGKHDMGLERRFEPDEPPKAGKREGSAKAAGLEERAIVLRPHYLLAHERNRRAAIRQEFVV